MKAEPTGLRVRRASLDFQDLNSADRSRVSRKIAGHGGAGASYGRSLSVCSCCAALGLTCQASRTDLGQCHPTMDMPPGQLSPPNDYLETDGRLVYRVKIVAKSKYL